MGTSLLLLLMFVALFLIMLRLDKKESEREKQREKQRKEELDQIRQVLGEQRRTVVTNGAYETRK